MGSIQQRSGNHQIDFKQQEIETMGERPTIAMLYDFDKTLCTKDMQEYSFIPKVNMSAEDFWREATSLAKSEKMDGVLAYMYLMLRKADSSDQPIKRQDFVDLGRDLEFFPGVESWFERMNQVGNQVNVNVEHYIISSGLKEIIEGSKIFNVFQEVFACEFYYNVNGVACWPKNAVNYTTKTQFLFRINKGVLDISNDNDLNKFTLEEDRPVPFRNMIYIGDGLTDVPCMKLVKVNGGHSIAVYQDGGKAKVDELLKAERVDFLTRADYTEHSELDKTVKDMIAKMAIADRLHQKSKDQMCGL
jgi:2-hydroxy-3-keto-5-methylthiopentenyl-1-phosphate phosphatase